jgi:hypothetical protein
LPEKYYILKREFFFFAPLVLKLDNQTIKRLREKQKHNKLLFKITEYGLRNRKPPEKLIKEARELGRRIDIPEAELRNIESSTS